MHAETKTTSHSRPFANNLQNDRHFNIIIKIASIEKCHANACFNLSDIRCPFKRLNNIFFFLCLTKSFNLLFSHILNIIISFVCVYVPNTHTMHLKPMKTKINNKKRTDVESFSVY